MLSRSCRLLIVSAANAGYVAFQKKVEEGQANALLPAQKRKLRSFYSTSRAVAHLPSVLDVARTIVYNDYKPKPTTSKNSISKGSITGSTSSRESLKSSSKSDSIRKPQRRSTVRRSLSFSGKNGKVQNEMSSAKMKSSELSQKSQQRKTLSTEKRDGVKNSYVTAASSSSSSSSSPFHSRDSTSVPKKGVERSTKRQASPPTDPSVARKRSLSPSRISVERMQKGQKKAVEPAGKRIKSIKSTSRPVVAPDHQIQKVKPLTKKEKALRQQFSSFRRAVFKKTKLKSGPKLEERIRQLWALLQKKKIKRERQVSLAVRVLRPKALGSIRAKKFKKKSTGSPLSLRKGSTNELLSSSTLRSKNLTLARKNKKVEKELFLKFCQSVSAQTGASSTRQLHLRRIRELWKLLVDKPITLQERVSIAVRVLGSESNGTSTAKKEKKIQKTSNTLLQNTQRRKKGSVTSPLTSSSSTKKITKRFKNTSALRGPFGVMPHTTRSSFTPQKISESISGSSSSTTPPSALMSKKEQKKAKFDAFHSAVLTSFKVTPLCRLEVEKALRRSWCVLLPRKMSFDQKVLAGVKAIQKKFPKLPHSAPATPSPLSVAPVVGPLPRPPGGVTLATTSKAVVTPLDRRKGSGARAGSSSYAPGSGGRLPVSRRHLCKKQVEFLSFYRAMLMTGHISRDPGERRKAIRFLWTNTKNLKNLEARIKLAEAHLAGAIRIPLVAPLSEGSENAFSLSTPEAKDTTGSTASTIVMPKNSS